MPRINILGVNVFDDVSTLPLHTPGTEVMGNGYRFLYAKVLTASAVTLSQTVSVTGEGIAGDDCSVIRQAALVPGSRLWVALADHTDTTKATYGWFREEPCNWNVTLSNASIFLFDSRSATKTMFTSAS